MKGHRFVKFCKKPPRVGLRFLMRLKGQYNSADIAKLTIERYGRFVRFGWFSRLYLLADADGVEEVFLKNKDHISKDVSFYHVLMILFGKGLLTSEGGRWRAKRDWFQPLFTPAHLLQYAQTVIEVTQDCAARFARVAESQEVVDITQEMLILALTISVKIFFHEDLAYERAKEMTIHFNVQHHCAVKAGLPGVRSAREREKKLTAANEFIDAFALELLEKHRFDHHENLATRLYAFKDPATGLSYDQRDLIDEVKTFLGTGHDTVGTVLGWAWHLLLTHKEAYRNLQKEVDAVLHTREITIADIEDLPYTLMVFNETARLYPPIWVLPRTPLKNMTILGYRMKPGAVILTIPYVLQRLPCYWESPELFNPERFSKVQAKPYPKHAFLPFGIGPRVCIARVFAEQQARLILAMLTQQYEFTLLEDSVEVPANSLITLKPFKPIHVKINKRGLL